MDTWLIFALAGLAIVCGYQAWESWRTGIARIPLSFFTLDEFDRGRSQHFWPITIINVAVSAAALIGAAILAWHSLTAVQAPIANLQALDGCYGRPTFSNRAPYALRVENGAIFDRDGTRISTISVLGQSEKTTSVAFSPGILLSVDRGKNLVLTEGPTQSGETYLLDGAAHINVPGASSYVLTIVPCN